MGSIFNEKLLKSVICGTINSTRMHYLQLTCQQLRAKQKKRNKKKKKLKTWTRNANMQSKLHPCTFNLYERVSKYPFEYNLFLVKLKTENIIPK